MHFDEVISSEIYCISFYHFFIEYFSRQPSIPFNSRNDERLLSKLSVITMQLSVLFFGTQLFMSSTFIDYTVFVGSNDSRRKSRCNWVSFRRAVWSAKTSTVGIFFSFVIRAVRGLQLIWVALCRTERSLLLRLGVEQPAEAAQYDDEVQDSGTRMERTATIVNTNLNIISTFAI